MKRVINIVVLLICLILIQIYCHAENDNSQAQTASTQVTVVVPAKVQFKNEDNVITKEIEVGKKIKEPSHIIKEGYNFDGWYNGEHKWDFENDTVKEDLTLIAKYIPIENSNTDSESNNKLPITGDNILYWGSILLVSMVIFIETVKIMIKRRNK